MEPQERVDDILARYGHRPSPPVTAALELAAAVQQQRFDAGYSDRTEVTRSTALWALISTDGTVASALRGAGLDASRLGELLGVSGVPPAAGSAATQDAQLDAQFADALSRHLESVPPGGTLEPGDLALVLLRSSQSSGEGLLPERLARLGFDYGAGIAALERLPSGPGTDSAGTTTAGNFSRSVRGVRSRLGESGVVTAGRIAIEIQRIHPEYADRGFGDVRLRPSAGRRATVGEWLRGVASLYDRKPARNAPRPVIDGELTVFGLALLERELEQDLRDGRVFDIMGRRARERLGPQPDQTKWSSDAPAERDALGRRFLAEALVERLRTLERAGKADSFLIHIDGPWGSGKSSLFGFLERELRREGQEKFLVVHVNAWREQQLGVQWWTLHRALRRAVEAEAYATGRNAWERWARKLWVMALGRVDVIRARPVPFALVVLAAVALVAGLSLVEFADTAAKVLSSAAVVTAALAGAYRYLVPESYRSAEAFVASSANPMSEVRLLFARALRRSRHPVVFFVDDLDRCEPQYVIDFLEVVQNLVRDAPSELHDTGRALEVRGPYAFVAADGQWIRSSYENHYSSVRATRVPGRPLGYLFLEKIFQLQVRLPSITPEAKTAFYESLLTPGPAGEPSPDQQRLKEEAIREIQRAPSGSEVMEVTKGRMPDDPDLRMEVLGAAAVRFSEITGNESSMHELLPFGRFLDPNPRSIRLFVNTYGMLQSLRTLEGAPVDTFPLALWAVVEIRWPLLADHLRTRPEIIDSEASREDAPEEIVELLRSDEVQAVVTGSGLGALTADHVRDCTGAVRL
ncbi:P-loop NTPase fold protein [Kocuria sp. M1R5S2]|uniref:KAP family P-loop NTPase fold protein n=1 Tax=Kocuria rhizosphaerae TaxID=3376285 RepID=UPI003787DACC